MFRQYKSRKTGDIFLGILLSTQTAEALMLESEVPLRRNGRDFEIFSRRLRSWLPALIGEYLVIKDDSWRMLSAQNVNRDYYELTAARDRATAVATAIRRELGYQVQYTDVITDLIMDEYN